MLTRFVGATLIFLAFCGITFAQKPKPINKKKVSAEELVTGVANRLVTNDAKILTGFTTSDVSIYFVNANIRGRGITELQLEDELEKRLASAGFKIEQFNEPGFDVRIDALGSGGSTIVYSVTFVLIDRTILERDRTVVQGTPVWSEERLKVVDQTQFIASLRKTLNEILDKFLNDRTAAKKGR